MTRVILNLQKNRNAISAPLHRINRKTVDVESFMVEGWICHHDPFEYEYRVTEYEHRVTEYEYDCPDDLHE